MKIKQFYFFCLKLSWLNNLVKEKKVTLCLYISHHTDVLKCWYEVNLDLFLKVTAQKCWEQPTQAVSGWRWRAANSDSWTCLQSKRTSQHWAQPSATSQLHAPSASSAANKEHSSWFLTEYTCVNVHPHSGSFHDNKDLGVGATTYQQCIETTLNNSSLKCKFNFH